MDVLAAHRSGLRQFDSRVQLITAQQWHNPTPNDEWDVQDLVEHLVYEQLWVPPLLAGKTIAEVGTEFEGDILGEDAAAAWTVAAAAARDAFEQPGVLEGTVHLSFGDVPTSMYLWHMTVDLVVHAWDLARAIRSDEQMPNDVLASVLAQAKPMAAQFAGTSAFAPPIPVPGCTDDLTELLALLGRAR